MTACAHDTTVKCILNLPKRVLFVVRLPIQDVLITASVILTLNSKKAIHLKIVQMETGPKRIHSPSIFFNM